MRRSLRTWPVTFMVEGVNIGRFLRYAGEKGIRLQEIRRSAPKRLTASVQEADLPLVQTIALQGGWTFTTGERKGAGKAASAIRQRWLLAAMILMAGMAILTASRMMWRIDIIDGGAYEADIRAAVAEAGITVPMLRGRIDIGSLREQLEWRYPRIAWFECGWRGSTLVIRPVEGTLPRTDGAYDGACDVVASRDGIVAAIVTRAGTPVVQVGDIVRKGDVLIRGEERTTEGAVKPVAARGSVRARVWQGASVRMSSLETITTYTGKEEIVWTIRTPWFDLWPMAASSFEQYDTAVSEMAVGGIFLPMRLLILRRMEAEITTRQRSQTELEADAYAAARRKLCEKIGAEESLIDIWGNCSMIDTENIVSVAIGEMLVEIGTQVPVSGMAAPGE